MTSVVWSIAPGMRGIDLGVERTRLGMQPRRSCWASRWSRLGPTTRHRTWPATWCWGAIREQAGPPPEFSPEQAAVYIQARDEMLTLLDADPEDAVEREERRQARKLRRDSDRLRLELALGNPPPERETA